MSSILAALNPYSDLITAASTFFIALLTVLLWFENRTLRKAGSAPEVVAYLSPDPNGTGAVEFVLANVGRGPAFDVKFDFIYDEEDFTAHSVLLKNDKDRMPIAALPQDEKIKTLLGVGFVLFGKVADDKNIGPIKPFGVRIEYRDILGKMNARQRNIDIRQFSGLPGIAAKSNERKVAESIEKIEKHMAKLARQSERFSAFVDVTKLSDEYRQVAKGES